MKPPPLRALRRGLVLPGLCGLLACTTIDDFRRYSPEQRAQLVCERDTAIRAQDMRLAEWHRLHAQTQAALDRGYLVHRQCRRVATATTEVCETQGNRRVCQTKEGEPRWACEDTPVPLVAALERSKLAAYAENIVRGTQERDQAWQRCFAGVLALSPEAAFSRF
ncbi:hypothetical protein JNX00_22020 [Hydrogenophaga sp. YM1]|uniref:hypothetical protein n=1 Tax=Hydrogenophaga sp. YM1 TaxID=2806262 RepID=UPI001956A74B|nr:hypothetical protein [Hydrogenophaga sp. YM1]QRR34269.1 hypothetical protein JNX00_22020 [Hydrogenophaga sp. YM1]